MGILKYSSTVETTLQVPEGNSITEGRKTYPLTGWTVMALGLSKPWEMTT